MTENEDQDYAHQHSSNCKISEKRKREFCLIAWQDIRCIKAYQLNITDKIDKLDKLESQLKRWLWRGLSLEGKNLIVKTFCLSQLFYFMQSCEM